MLALMSSAGASATTGDTLRSSRWGASVAVHPGHVIAVDKYQKAWQKDRKNISWEVRADHVALPSDSDAFAADYNYPVFSASLRYSLNHGVTMHKGSGQLWGTAVEAPYDSRMGNNIALYGTFTRPVLRSRRWQLDYSLSAGTAYSRSTYDKEHNVDNELVGAHWMIYFGAGAHVSYRMTRQWRITAGVDYWHVSNGALSRPNQGANLVGPSLALVYSPYYDLLWASGARYNPAFGKYCYLNITAGVGVKSLNEEWLLTQYETPAESPDYRTGSFKCYLAYSLQTDFMYRYARRWASGVGLDVDYGAYSSRVERIDRHNGVDVSHSPWSIGVALKHEVFYRRISMAMALGCYLYREMGENARMIEKPYYERIGLRYAIPGLGGLTIGANVKAHLTKADLTEIVVAMPIQLKAW